MMLLLVNINDNHYHLKYNIMFLLLLFNFREVGMQATIQKIDLIENAEKFEEDENMMLKLEIKRGTLKRLLETNQVCASDFRCMDCISKQQIKNLCLQTCLKCLS